jgi:hypothetical protein
MTSYDRRAALPEQPITTGDGAVDDALNTQLRALRAAVRGLQQQSVIEPLSVEPSRTYDGLLAVCDGGGWDPAGDGAPHLLVHWQGVWRRLLDDRHLEAPLETQDPHPQYWHKAIDAAGVALSITAPLALTAGAQVTPWDTVSVPDYQVGALLDGTITLGGSDAANGLYLMSVYLQVQAAVLAQLSFDITVNGVSDGRVLHLNLGVQQTKGALSWTSLVAVNTDAPAALQLRNVAASGPYTVLSAVWSCYRVAPGGGVQGFTLPSGVSV